MSLLTLAAVTWPAWAVGDHLVVAELRGRSLSRRRSSSARKIANGDQRDENERGDAPVRLVRPGAAVFGAAVRRRHAHAVIVEVRGSIRLSRGASREYHPRNCVGGVYTLFACRVLPAAPGPVVGPLPTPRFRYDYASRTVWLDPSDRGVEGGWFLCPTHAANVRAPVGWAVDDRRGQQHPPPRRLTHTSSYAGVCRRMTVSPNVSADEPRSESVSRCRSRSSSSAWSPAAIGLRVGTRDRRRRLLRRNLRQPHRPLGRLDPGRLRRLQARGHRQPVRPTWACDSSSRSTCRGAAVGIACQFVLLPLIYVVVAAVRQPGPHQRPRSAGQGPHQQRARRRVLALSPCCSSSARRSSRRSSTAACCCDRSSGTCRRWRRSS